MDSPSDGLRAWSRRTFSFANDAKTWQERLGLLFLLLGAVVLVGFRSGLGIPLQWILVLAWLVLFALMARGGILHLFGPVLFYDMIRIGRKRMNFNLRTLYAIALGSIMAYFYYIETFRFNGSNIAPKEQAKIGEEFFWMLAILQFFFLAIITPGYVAGAIAEEKQRKTLEFLLATDLRNREIIFGKLISRVANLFLYVLAGLPVLSLIQFFGGIDPDVLLMCYGVTLMTIVSFSSVSILASIMARKPWEAIGLSYFFLIGYFVLSSILQLGRALTWADTPIYLFGRDITLNDALDAIGSGNILVSGARYLEGIAGVGPGGTRFVLNLFREYMLFHLFAVLLCLGYSIWRLRAIALSQLFGNVGSRKREKKGKGRRKPPVGDYPMLWKEIYAEGSHSGLAARILMGLMVLASFSPPVIGFLLEYSYGQLDFWMLVGSSKFWNDTAAFMNVYVRTVTVVVGIVILLRTATRGAQSIRREKDQQTLDDLLTTTLTANEIIYGKWWGCILGMRWVWIWLGFIWLISILTGGLMVVAILPLIISTLLYAGAYAWIGIYFSLTCKSSLRATMWTIASSIFFGGGYMFFFGLCCLLPMSLAHDGAGRELDWLIYTLLGISPPVAYAYMPMSDLTKSQLNFGPRDEMPFYVSICIGWLIWIFFSMRMATLCLHKFKEMTNRYPYSPQNPVPKEDAEID